MTSTENVDPVEYKSILDTADKLNAKVQNLKRAAAKPSKPKVVKRIKVAPDQPFPSKKPKSEGSFNGNKNEGDKKPFDKNQKRNFDKNQDEKKPFDRNQGDKKNFDKKSLNKVDKNAWPVKQEDGNEKTDWKELKKQKKELKLHRQTKKVTKSFHSLMDQAKQLWITLTLKNLTKEKQHEVAAQMHEVLKGNILKCSWKHDTSRYLQALISKGSPESIGTVFEELKDHILDVSLGKYSHWCTVQLLKHGNKKHKQHIIASFEGKVSKLMNSSVGCRVLEEAYNDHATAKERARLIQEFYSLDYRFTKDDSVRTLKDAIEKKPENTAETLTRLNTLLKKQIDKGRWRLSLFHTLLYEYLNHAEEEDKKEMMEAVRENLLEMIHTKEGARVAMISLWQSDKKVRKQIVKTFKGKVVDICKEAQGHRVLLALFDCVDDSVLVSKAIVSEILNSLADVMSSDSGRKVLLYLVAHRERMFFDKDTVQYLSSGDGNPYTKKDINDIHNELKAAAAPAITAYVAENISFFAEDNGKTFFLRVLLTHLPEPSQVFVNIADYVASQDWGVVSEVKSFWKLIAYFCRNGEHAGGTSLILIQRWAPDIAKKIAVNFEGKALLAALILGAKKSTESNYQEIVKIMKKCVSTEGLEIVNKWVRAASKDKESVEDDTKSLLNILGVKKQK